MFPMKVQGYNKGQFLPTVTEGSQKAHALHRFILMASVGVQTGDVQGSTKDKCQVWDI